MRNGTLNTEGERIRRLNGMLRVAVNRKKRYGKSRRGNRFYVEGAIQMTSDFYIEELRIRRLLGQHDVVAAMESRRKAKQMT